MYRKMGLITCAVTTANRKKLIENGWRNDGGTKQVQFNRPQQALCRESSRRVSGSSGRNETRRQKSETVMSRASVHWIRSPPLLIAVAFMCIMYSRLMMRRLMMTLRVSVCSCSFDTIQHPDCVARHLFDWAY